MSKNIEMNENIEEIEKLLIKPKEWRHMGEVDVKKRPKNSLLTQEEIDFEQGPSLIAFSSKQNDEIERISLKRLREGTFDNHVYNIMKKVEIVEEVYESSGDVEVTDVIALYNEIEGDLMGMVDFGNNGFIPDSEIRIVKNESVEYKKKKNPRSLDKIRNVTVLKK